VVNALREQNIQVAAGSIGDAPAADDQMFQISVRAAGRFTKAEDFEDVVVKAATMARSSGSRTSAVWIWARRTMRRCCGSAASRRRASASSCCPQRNAIQVVRGRRKRTEPTAPRTFRPDSKAEIAFDNVTVVAESIWEVLLTLAEAIGLVVLVMFLFLQNWRSTIIPAITIPVSLIGTFAFVKLFGFSINTLTLFGIVLATGIVVDDAIVVIENIERHMRGVRKSARRAAIDAMAKCFPPSSSSAWCWSRSSCRGVFSGHHGAALSAVLADDRVFRRPVGVQRRDVHAGVVGAAARSSTARRARFSGRQPRDRRRHQSLRAHAAIRAPLGTGHAAGVRGRPGGHVDGLSRVPSSFVPDEDEGYFIVIIQAPAGSSLEYTSNIARQAEQVIMISPKCWPCSRWRIQLQRIGAESGLMFARLKDFEHRKLKSESLAALVGRLRGLLTGGIAGALVIPVAPPRFRASTFGGFQFEVPGRIGHGTSRISRTRRIK
jgi:HAE1 family hydrophobic/amphiphilic exporter-1